MVTHSVKKLSARGSCLSLLSLISAAGIVLITAINQDIKKEPKMKMVGASGIEPMTSCMSRKRSNLLSYAPITSLRFFFMLPPKPLRVNSIQAFLHRFCTDRSQFLARFRSCYSIHVSLKRRQLQPTSLNQLPGLYQVNVEDVLENRNQHAVDHKRCR